MTNIALIFIFSGVSVGTSCFTLVAISLERYFAICRPLHSRKWQTLSHAYKILVVCWALAFIVMIPIGVYTKYIPLPKGNARCTEFWDNKTWEKIYAILIVLILLLFPVIIMSIAYGLISMTLWTGMKLDAQSEKGNIVFQFYNCKWTYEFELFHKIRGILYATKF